MIDKRLTHLVQNAKRGLWLSVLIQWASLAVQIGFVFAIGTAVRHLLKGDGSGAAMLIVVGLLNVGVRLLTSYALSMNSHRTARLVKQELRRKIFGKLIRLGVSYREQFSTAELLQISMEGVEQLEIYFAQYLPQLIYSMLAPLTLFAALFGVSWPAALFLLICAPLIPLSIAMVQRFAKKLLGKYWNSYTNLSDHFLENITGLTTLKIYDVDGLKARQMDEDAEHFRKITMKVLSMQLNSIIIMDVIAFGGAAVAMVIALLQFRAGSVDLPGAIAVILLAADFFIPLRQLGSLFHVAMNGIAAGGKILRFLDLPEPRNKEGMSEGTSLFLSDVKFSYTEEKEVLRGVNLFIPQGQMVSVCGASGCGKSTLAGLLSGRNRGYQGRIQFGGVELSDIAEEERLRRITVVAHDDYVFAGTVRENLLFAKPDAADDELRTVLSRVALEDIAEEGDLLDRGLTENASNLSGGQKQRLVLARALLKNSPIYIFDEATSNIDAESENRIMDVIQDMKKNHTVVLISHRLQNLVPSDMIYFMKNGIIQEQGTHDELLSAEKGYAQMFREQMKLERFHEEVTE